VRRRWRLRDKVLTAETLRGFDSRRLHHAGKSGRFAAMMTSRRFCFSDLSFVAATGKARRGGEIPPACTLWSSGIPG